MKKRGENYFDMLVVLAEHTCQNAEILKEAFLSSPDKMQEKYVQLLQDAENKFYAARKILEARLLRDFITPIEREDLCFLAVAIKKVNEEIENTMLFTVAAGSAAEGKRFSQITDLIAQCCQQLKELLEAFSGFQKNDRFRTKYEAMMKKRRAGKETFFHFIKITSRTQKLDQLWSEEQICHLMGRIWRQCYYIADNLRLITLKNS